MTDSAAVRSAIYPGSFDPLTNGHLSLIHRGLKMFDSLIVAIAVNPKKTPLFTVDERKAMILEALGNDPRIEVADFQGLLVDFAKSRKLNVVLRGLRAVSDFEFEFQLANMNRRLSPELETVFMMTGEDYFYIS
ncbi:MAG TPA: pantetheine-phosphate adenylyltransferase, partial [Archangium sp.]